MVDLSVSPVAENMAGTAEAVQAAKTLGVEVEGELGRLDGDEDQADDGACSSSFTDETEAVEFAGTTGVTCLAVAVGNRHGRYARRPALDFNLLSHLASAVGVPIALHGCSGMTEADLWTAIDCGVAKMNFNTDLRAAYFAALHEGLGKAGPALDLLGLKDGVIEAVAVAAGRLLGLVGWSPVGSSSAEVGGL